MVDFVKITIPPEYIEGIWYNQILEFISEHSESTGEETSNKSIAEHQGLKFIIYKNSKYAEIQGSLHKYFNKGKHNANDFSLANLLEVLEDINTKFQIPIETFKLSNIEFGVNIEPPIKTNLILNNLLYHHGNKFKDIYIKGGNYKQVEHTRYYLKMYNKYVQYKDKYVLPDIENMRIEMKYVRMKDLNKDGLYCLQDLCKPTVLGAIYDLLIKSWANTLLFDKTINRKALKSNCRNTKYHQWSNPNYWANLIPQRRNDQKRIYNEVVASHSDKIHAQIQNLIAEKWSLLLNNSL